MKKAFIAPELELLKFESDAAIMEGVNPDPWSSTDPFGPDQNSPASINNPFKLGLPERVDLNEYFKK